MVSRDRLPAQGSCTHTFIPREQIMNMNPDTQRMLFYDANKKSTGVAYLLWLLFGILGVHRFYLGRTGSGLTILLLTLGSILLMTVGIGFVTMAIPAIWVFIDLFLIPGMARSYNTELISRL